MTTGAIKAIGGGALSLVAGYLVTTPGPLWAAGLAALLIALSANTLNLLDVRPGRCLFGFGVGALTLFFMLLGQHSVGSGLLLWAAAAFALILYPLDAYGAAMLGDTGSNAFGAVLGVAGAVFFSRWEQSALVVLLLALQVWCERYSLTRLIDKTPLLRALDRKIGVRGQPDSSEVGG